MAKKGNTTVFDNLSKEVDPSLFTRMYKTVTIFLALIVTAFTAELSASYALLEKNTSFEPDLKTEQVDTHNVIKKDSKPEEHPVYKAEEGGRANIKPVRPLGPIIKHDMLADQPLGSTEINRADRLAIPNYGYIPVPSEIAYPDIPYAPGYGYDNSYMGSNNYDAYGNGPTGYTLEPDTSALSLLWSQVPDSRTMVNFAGRAIVWVVNSIIVLFVGSILTVGMCSYTNLCTITFHGVGPIHEEMRSLMSPEKLEKISHAAEFVKSAIDKYQKIQKVTGQDGSRNRRSAQL